MPIGQVVRAHSNQFYVLVEGREVLCRPRGKFRLDQQTVLAGDMVEVHIEDEEGRIDKVLPRRTMLTRPAVANIDQALVVFTLRDPEADYPFLDRVLIHAEQAGTSAIIILNKIDLLTDDEIEQFCVIYGKQVGYPVIPFSAKLQIGVDDLRPLLPHRVSVLAGHSGVGKSKLVQSLEPERTDIRIGELSLKLGRGKHTTRHVELIRLSSGGLLVDAPGFTYLEFPTMEPQELSRFFPEFQTVPEACRFTDCVHRKEPDCGIRAALARGEIAKMRYNNYLFFLAEIEAQRRW